MAACAVMADSFVFTHFGLVAINRQGTRCNLVSLGTKSGLRAAAFALGIVATAVAAQAATPASATPTPGNDQYLVTWKMTANGHSKRPSDNSGDFSFEASRAAGSEGQAVVNFDASGNRLNGRIINARVFDELDMKTLPVSIKILCGPISVWDHEHRSLKTVQSLAGTDYPEWMPGAPRKQPDGPWLIGHIFSGNFCDGPSDPHFATVVLNQSWRDRFHYEGGNAQLADVVTSGPIHSVCDSPALPPKLTVENPSTSDYAGHTHQVEAIPGFKAPGAFDVPSTGPVADVFFKEWKFRMIERLCSGPGVCGTVPVEVDWQIAVRRLGKCHVSGEIPLNDEPINPNIHDEEMEIGVEHGSDSIDPDSGVAALNMRLTCDQVPIKNAKVDVKVEVQKNTGGHTHDPAGRPRGRLTWNGHETRLTDAKPSIQVKTDDDGRAHFTFKPGKAVVCGKHSDGSPRTDSAGECDKFGIAGIYRITATSVRFPDRKATGAIEAKVDDLSHVDADPNYVNDIGAASHTSGDNATASTKQRLHPFANAFRDIQVQHNQQLAACGAPEWPIYPLWIIDISLPFGGQYDFQGNWSTPHQTHGRGDGVDLSVHRRNQTAAAWPSDSLNVPVCDGYKISPQGWLMIKMYEAGLQYGHWDQSDFNAATQPWHLHVNQ